MSPQDLLELASLDALGLLEEPERAAFDRAFMAAAPPLQAQIRREQARVAQDESLLPAVEPPVGLRALVLNRLRNAMSVRRRILPPLLPSSGVSPIWRMGAISAAAASIVLGFAVLQIQSDFRQVVSSSKQIEWSKAWSQEFGANFDRAFFKYDHVMYKPVSTQAMGEAVLLFDPEQRRDDEGTKVRVGELYVRDFPASTGAYQIALIDKDNKLVAGDNGDTMTVICGFTCSADNGSKLNFRITVKVEQLDSGYGLAIVGPGEGNPILGVLKL